ncbi:MAG: type IV pilus modification protein PilV [Pseudomonadota bacterium]
MSLTRHQGYTLLEILVATLLLTTGLIGVATMQVNGTRLNNSAYLRSQATIQAYDIVDRMRANLTNARIGGYDIQLADPIPAAAADIAQTDLFQWRTNIDYHLPSGTGAVVTAASPAVDIPARVTVTVQWQDGRAAADVRTFTLTTDL